MASTRPTYHIPFPKTFLAVNTPVKKTVLSPTVSSPTESVVPAHGFLSNRPASGRHQSVSSVSSVTSSVGVPASEASTISPPSSPTTKLADSPVLGPKIFAPLAVNTKHPAPPGFAEMTAAERQRRLSFERSTFLSNIY
ncbi:hypothetical protein yc1106_02826 [Curvularia clavata]|uniref:Uncharacterized protein n=1 Tax=Curvularia clavata TaxID=95742 RepID=A0A9Q8Z3H6_CURCL|nr:hypothetical protein yc1106_02826 [Curvularia clavata]